ncbi:hypothetical protein ES703_22851 [subsurface metagenome]
MSKANWAIACEFPVFLKSDELNTLLGHIDLLVAKNGILYICDYKPDQNFNRNAAPCKSFINSVPQIAAYALIFKKMFGLSKVKCVTFNQKGAWLYDPQEMLDEITFFMANQREDSNLPWIPYLYDEF